MRIAHVTSHVSRRGFGVRNAVERLSRAQAEEGHDIRVFAIEDRSWREGDHGHWQGADITMMRGLGPEALGYAPALAGALLKFRPDLVHVHGLWMLPLRSVLRWHRKSGLPFVISPHGMLAPEALSYSSVKKRLVRVWFQDACFAAAAALHATSPGEVSDVRAFGYAGRMLEVSHGVDLPGLPDGQRRAPPEVVTIGRRHAVKGMDVLIKAWAQVQSQFPLWRLRLIGPVQDDCDTALHRLSVELGVERVTIEGPAWGSDRDKVMAGAELFILPSRVENFALTVAESLAVGTPVIATRGAPWQGLAEHQCGWWTGLEAPDLAQALSTAMMLSQEQRRAMGQRGRAWMERDFAWPIIAARMMAHYATLAEEVQGSTGIRRDA